MPRCATAILAALSVSFALPLEATTRLGSSSLSEGSSAHFGAASEVLTASKIDYGEEFAATEPLVGPTKSFQWAPYVQRSREVCAGLDAAVTRHTYWFKSSNISQQTQERAFLEGITTQLCADADQSDDAYFQILHGMLDVVRVAINRHVFSAFWVKATCARLVGTSYRIDELSEFYNETWRGSQDCMLNSSISSGRDSSISLGRDALAVGCLETVMLHEKYNLAEGFYFVNMSMFMVEQGAAFCRRPDLPAVVATLSEELEHRMAYHRSNHAFQDLLDTLKEQLCTEDALDDGGAAYKAEFERFAATIDDQVINNTNSCSLAMLDGSNPPDVMTYVTSDLPTAAELVRIFGGNTRLTIAAAAVAIRSALGDDLADGQACLDSETGAPDPAAAQRIRDKLRATGLPHTVLGNSSTSVSGHSIYLALPTVYHKLAMMCKPNYAHNLTYVDVCTGA